MRAKDPSLQSFGADGHGYRCASVSSHQIQVLEETFDHALPPEYSLWLQSIGSGAGPYYGLWNPDHILAGRRDDIGTAGDVEAPSSIGRSEIEALATRMRLGSPAIVAITTNNLTGALPIGAQGCNGYTYLMLAGPFRGCVFGECCDLVGEPWTAAAAFWPEHFRMTLEPPPFLTWMDAWIDGTLRELG